MMEINADEQCSTASTQPSTTHRLRESWLLRPLPRVRLTKQNRNTGLLGSEKEVVHIQLMNFFHWLFVSCVTCCVNSSKLTYKSSKISCAVQASRDTGETITRVTVRLSNYCLFGVRLTFSTPSSPLYDHRSLRALLTTLSLATSYTSPTTSAPPKISSSDLPLPWIPRYPFVLLQLPALPAAQFPDTF